MDGHLYDNEKLLEVPVKAGWKAGTKITFTGEGDEEVMKLASGYVNLK
jgi:DnaJ-class molecular chaperone